MLDVDRVIALVDWAQLTCVLASTVIYKLWWPDLVPLQYVCEFAS